MYDYNTTRPPLVLKGYGRNIQKLMEQLEQIQDKTLRTQKAHAIVRLMEMINPNAESLQKRWDDLYILSGYTLDVDGSIPKPIQRAHPEGRCIPMPPMEKIKYKYYGRHMELLLKKIIGLSSAQTQEQMLIVVAKLMRRFSGIWNNDYISNERIMEDIKRMLPADHLINVEIIRTILTDDNANGTKNKVKYPTKSPAAHIPKNRVSHTQTNHQNKK